MSSKMSNNNTNKTPEGLLKLILITGTIWTFLWKYIRDSSGAGVTSCCPAHAGHTGTQTCQRTDTESSVPACLWSPGVSTSVEKSGKHRCAWHHRAHKVFNNVCWQEQISNRYYSQVYQIRIKIALVFSEEILTTQLDRRRTWRASSNLTESETFKNTIQTLKQKCHIRQYDRTKVHKQWWGSWPSHKWQLWKERRSNSLQSTGGHAGLGATGDG